MGGAPMKILKAIFGCWAGHDPIYRRKDGVMAAQCMRCNKWFDLPWKSEQVPVPTAFELERLMRK